MVAAARPAGRGPVGAVPAHARVRAADVAAAAKVSISTVSLVVNDKWDGRVAPATADRVRREIDRLGYVVDESARRLATGVAAAIAVVTPAFTNPFYARVSIGAAAALGDDFQVLFSVPEAGGGGAAQARRLRGMRLAGALVAAPSPEMLDLLPDGFPVVVLDAPDADPVRPRVDLDVAGGAAGLASHLLDLGHRRVAFMGGTPSTQTFRLRRDALDDRLRAGGGALVDVAGFESAVDAGAAYTAAAGSVEHLLARGVTAVVGATDLHAYGVLRALAEFGCSVPGDVSVAGFDDQPLSAFVAPSLTTVSFPADELGRRAALLLADLLRRDGRPTGPGAPPPQVTVLPVSLSLRDSTGPAAR